MAEAGYLRYDEKKTDSAKCVWQSPFFNYSIADA